MDEVTIETQTAKTQFHLRIEPDDKGDLGNIAIDLDEPGWMKTHAHLMRVPGYWVLVHESGIPTLTVRVNAGDQPYFTKRHIGSVMGPAGEVVCLGIGKKCADGSVLRLWLMPNGMICGGDDVDDIGVKLLSSGY